MVLTTFKRRKNEFSLQCFVWYGMKNEEKADYLMQKR